MNISEKFSRKKSPEWHVFRDKTNSILKENPNLQRLDCLNPVKAIKSNFEFNYAPEVSTEKAWANFLKLDFYNFNLNFGVRHALWLIFQKLSKIHLPKGIYPVYQQIAQDVNLPYTEYEDFSFQGNCVLVTFPAFGKDIEKEEFDLIVDWLAQSEENLLIIDRVYDYERTNTHIQKLIQTNQVIICYSLSKFFLSPMLMGLTILPTTWTLEETVGLDENKAKVLLTKYKNFPQEQQAKFNYRWKKLGYEPCLGYLRKVAIEPPNSISTPSVLFGSTRQDWVVSCLHETNAFDEDDIQDCYYVTVLSNFSKGYDKYSKQYSKANIHQSTYKDKFFVAKDVSIGINKAKHLAKENDPLIIIKTKIKNFELNNSPNGFGYYVKRNFIVVDQVLDLDFKPILIEEAYSRSLGTNSLLAWESVRPRSLSILPIKQSCQAKCSFCFSHSSISDDITQSKYLEQFEPMCIRAKTSGAERLVITGGGEPTLLAHHKLLDIMKIGKEYFDSITMITNGYELANSDDIVKVLKDYEENGLTVLSVSRHSIINNEQIMHLNIDIDKIAKTFSENELNLKLRLVCVLQKQGVHDEKSLAEYLDWSADNGIKEICFKELYVAATNESVYHDSQYNKWCEENQVAMDFLVRFMDDNLANKINSLPWGSPIYDLSWKGKKIKIAVYTEPSIFWERTHGICRSWNLMSDGRCYANLETKDSLLSDRKIIEKFSGVLEKIDGSMACFSIKDSDGVDYDAEYFSDEFEAKGIKENRRFVCYTYEEDGEIGIEFIPYADRVLSKEELAKIDKILERI